MAASNIPLSVSPEIDEKKYPDIYADLLNIHNAIKLLQEYIDLYIVPKITIHATQTIIRGAAVNIYSSSGLVAGRLANATGGTKPCHGFALDNISSGGAGEIQTIGLNSYLTGLSPGATYYLGTADGTITKVSPGGGDLSQQVGIAISPTELLYRPAFTWK